MKILHVLDHSIPVLDGYSLRTLSILRHQRELGWETVHVTGPKHEIPGPPVEQVDGWEFFRTDPSTNPLARLPVVQYMIVVNDLTRRLAEVARQTRPDVLHAHSPSLNGLAALRVGRRLRIPVVYEVRALWEDAAVSAGVQSEGGVRYRLSRALENLALREADAVTTICEGLRTDILGRGIPAPKITVIPNAVDAEAFGAPGATDDDLARRLGLAGKLVLGFLGSFYRYEGLHLLIEAMPALLARNPDVRLLLVGGGEDDAMLRRLVLERGLGGAVVFAGRVPHAEVPRYYDLVDILVYPRLPERLTHLVTPLKPLEAMAREKIVLASDVGGLRELVRDDDTGFLFRAGDPTALAERVLEVARRRADWPAMRERARRFVETERSWHGSVSRYRAVYDRLTAA
jgi:PEP-CTERM/exosortase A-associated glycosyltransferase